ncbi:hypothetical protein CK203_081724 [Vitis vinifera]|uniref:MULE transposase domain-containing protein n=1 Tax=Vitis vinifera TaxID=29760 RepID=A0A438EF89_VITVI|nr:hypothetical protein CK203_081724 [Vitis vinifera]
MSGPYKGALFSASSDDANDGMFPLAYGLFSSENYEDWLWFLEKLKMVIDCDYEVAMDSLRTFNHDLAKWVEENNPQHWAISKFKKMRWDKMTRSLLVEHKNGLVKWNGCIGPKTEEKIALNIGKEKIYSGSMRTLVTHDMPMIDEDGTVRDALGHTYPFLNPPTTKRPPGRLRKRRIESQFM